MSSKRDIRGLWRLYRFFRENQVTIVHTHLLEADIWGRYAAYLARVPIILSTEHSVNDWKRAPRTLKSSMRLRLDRFIANRSSGVVVVAKVIADFLVEYERIPPEKLHLIYNGIQVDRASAERTADSGRHVVIGTVGRLYKEKGIEILLEAFNRLCNDVPNLALRIAGDGALMSSLKCRAADLGLQKQVTFEGMVLDIPKFLGEIDIFVLSSLREGVPLSLLEAMLAQKAVVATRVGGIPEIIDEEKYGLLVEPGDVNGLIAAIERLLGDRALCFELGRNARAKVRADFDIDHKVAELQSYYHKLLREI